jgi:RNA polymerase sigma-70 factor (ECF subfamily)
MSTCSVSSYLSTGTMIAHSVTNDPTETSAYASAPLPLARREDVAMDRYACGDTAAFGDVYDQVAPRLRAFLLRQTRNASRAEDLLQQTFLQMHCARASFAPGAAVTPWAFAIARRLVIDGVRRTRRDVSYEEESPEHQRPSGDLLPDEVVQTKQAARRLEEVLARVPESQRIAFELLKYDGLTLAEAAEVLGTTINAVKLRAHKAYEAMRAALRDE